MATFEQNDFGAGIYRGRKAPPNSVYDALNALVNDEGHLFRRGGSAIWSTADTGTAPTRIRSFYMPGAAAARVFAWNDSNNYIFDGSKAPVAAGTAVTAPFGRPAMVAGAVVWPDGPDNFRIHAGSLKTSIYSTGTATFTHGSTAVTGVGTTWTTNVDPGMIILNTGAPVGNAAGIVAKVVSNTSLTLLEPWATATAAGVTYAAAPSLSRFVYGTTPLPTPGTLARVVSIAGVRKLMVTIANRVYMTSTSDPLGEILNTFLGMVNTDFFHELPAGSLILGGESSGNTAVFWTTRGVWAIDELELDPVDDFGNIQQPVRQVARDVILWSEWGLANWENTFVAPCLDDIYLMDAQRPIDVVSRTIRPLYRSYVAAGYLPGPATVHRGHYFLPIMNGTTLVDEFVCRLDRPTPSGRPFTRWSGHGAALAWTSHVVDGSAPKLLGIKASRVTDLTTALDAAGSAQDADATTHAFTVESNDDDLGPGIRPNTAEKVRYVYETAGGTPTINVSSAVGPEGASYTAATLKRGGGTSDGTDYSAWRVGRKAERIRFKFTTSSAVTSLILRRREVTIRQAGQT